jgi:hypothetical protein
MYIVVEDTYTLVYILVYIHFGGGASSLRHVHALPHATTCVASSCYYIRHVHALPHTTTCVASSCYYIRHVHALPHTTTYVSLPHTTT